MEYDKLLSPLKSHQTIIAHAGQLPQGLIGLQRYLSGQPEIWGFRFFRDGTKLVEALERSELALAPGVSHLLVVLPDDTTLQPGELDMLARQNNIRVLLILGKALRSQEDRRRFFYVRGG